MAENAGPPLPLASVPRILEKRAGRSALSLASASRAVKNSQEESWLPNLVGGASIWKLAGELNAPKLFDGRLVVPEIDDAPSATGATRWDLEGLVPLAQARRTQPAEVAVALGELQAALERIATLLSTPASGLDRYKRALTLPSPEGKGRASYFYAPAKRKIVVINWGASPPSAATDGEQVLTYESWDSAFKDKGSVSVFAAAGSMGAIGIGIAPTGENPTLASLEAAAEPKPETDKPKKEEKRSRPWWVWPFSALAVIALVLLALFVLRACEPPAETSTVDGADAATARDAGQASASTVGGEPSAAVGTITVDGDAAEGGALAAANAEDGGSAGDGGADAGDGDGGKLSNRDDIDDDVDAGDAAAKAGPHRRHTQPDAVKWRIAAGSDRVARTEQHGARYDVWLAPGRTFQGLGVEWQDKSGKWHAH